jgi:hypothetical protein
MKRALVIVLGMTVLPGLALAGEIRGHLATDDLPSYLRDRGEGISTSMFGTYIQKGQLLIYPFVEHYRNSNEEYKPAELGYNVDKDFRGDYEASEQLLFVAYGVSDRLAIEMEAALIQAELEKSALDPSNQPVELAEKGIGDVEGQMRWRWAHETSGRPEVFSYFETVAPTQKEGSLIGTSAWELKLGTGLTRGFRFGTMSLRAAVEYDTGSETKFDLGEIALEYLKRLSNSWRIYTGVEGTQDEWEVIGEIQWHMARNVVLKMNSGIGITSKATDWAPEMGVLFGF